MEQEIISKNLTVVFNNSFTNEVIQGMTKQEHDLLMLILAKLKRRGDKEISISFDTLRDLLDNQTLKNGTIVELSDSLWSKVKVVDYTLYAMGRPSGGVPLFSFWGVDEDELSLKVQMNPSLQYFVNSFERGNYSSLKFREFRQTKDKYGKLLFVLLSKWKHVGSVKYGRNELEYRLDVPLSYRNNARLFNDKVLKPAINNLKPFFPNLEVIKHKVRRRITHYEFTWTPLILNAKSFDSKRERKDITPKSKLSKVDKDNKNSNIIVDNIDELRYKRDVLKESLTDEELVALNLSEIQE